MKIALINEFSQASKNGIILEQLKSVVEPMGHRVFNTGMQYVNNLQDLPTDYSEENPRLTYMNISVQAALLLNSKAVDFVVTGCGTGQGAMLACNMFPGVVCGYCIEPTDAFLFLQINDGNALSIPYAKGFGWGAELNIKNIFEKAFSSPKGQGYPTDRKESQNRNAKILSETKKQVGKPVLEALKSIEPELLKSSLTKKFQECFFENCQDQEYSDFVKKVLSK